MKKKKSENKKFNVFGKMDISNSDEISNSTMSSSRDTEKKNLKNRAKDNLATIPITLIVVEIN